MLSGIWKTECRIRQLAGPTLDQRVKWHIGHAKNCLCRPIPPKLQQIIDTKVGYEVVLLQGDRFFPLHCLYQNRPLDFYTS